MEQILRAQSNFGATRNVTVAPTEIEKQCLLCLRFQLDLLFVFEKSVK